MSKVAPRINLTPYLIIVVFYKHWTHFIPRNSLNSITQTKNHIISVKIESHSGRMLLPWTLKPNCIGTHRISVQSAREQTDSVWSWRTDAARCKPALLSLKKPVLRCPCWVRVYNIWRVSVIVRIWCVWQLSYSVKLNFHG